MPTWLHLGTPPKTYNKRRDKCLQKAHNIKSVKDLRRLTGRPTNINTHNTTATCPCDACIENQLAGCKDPNKCTQAVQRILDNLNPMFNPNTSPRKDNLTLTHQRKEKNLQVRTVISHTFALLIQSSGCQIRSTDPYRIHHNKLLHSYPVHITLNTAYFLHLVYLPFRYIGYAYFRLCLLIRSPVINFRLMFDF